MTLTEHFFFKGNSIQVDKLNNNFQCLRSQILLWMARFDKDAALERFLKPLWRTKFLELCKTKT